MSRIKKAVLAVVGAGGIYLFCALVGAVGEGMEQALRSQSRPGC